MNWIEKDKQKKNINELWQIFSKMSFSPPPSHYYDAINLYKYIKMA